LRKRVAVLGAGIMGSSVALELARRGRDVVLVDAADAPFSGASRWNEGKIHLGYLYAADASLSTARQLLAPGVAFVDMVGGLVGCDLRPAISAQDDLYLVHRDSVVDAATTRDRFEAISALVRACPGSGRYTGDPSMCRTHALSRRELERLADARHVEAGYRVPERSISTSWVADRYVDALRAEPRIELAMATRVLGVRPAPAARGRWLLDADVPIDGPFDAVVNALWQGRLAIDHGVGLALQPGWSHRYRVSLFVRTRHPLCVESMVVATGPFGDIKNYNGRDFYLSWYRAGLLAESEAMQPPDLAPLSKEGRLRIIEGIRNGLGALVPSVHEILAQADDVQLRGGWVFAQGRGSLADPRASLHRRDRFGVVERDGYMSVDTGKYSTAPWLARGIADRLAPG
jgi:hypothetical protein